MAAHDPLATVSDPSQATAALASELLEQLQRQLHSGQRMLAVVRTQGAAIRRRDVKAVVASACELQVEIDRRRLLEDERQRILIRASALLAMPVKSVTMTDMIETMSPADAQLARQRQRQLRDLLRLLRSEHRTNRELMRQELKFLDHLLSLGGNSGGYGAGGKRPSRLLRGAYGRGSTLDLEA
jgi:hypothetical protein